MASQSPQVMDLTSLRAVLADLRARLLPSRFEKRNSLILRRFSSDFAPCEE
jgi:hypothetical protein